MPDGLGKDLRAVLDVAPRAPVVFARGVLAFGLRVGVTLACLAWALTTPSGVAFASACLLGGVGAAWTALAAHEAMHKSLTGAAWFDRGCVRLCVAPFLFPFAATTALHMMHHAASGHAADSDPELPHWSKERYLAASRWRRWAYRNKPLVHVLVLGLTGGVLFRLWSGAWTLWRDAPRYRGALTIDLACIVVSNLALHAVLMNHGLVFRYWLFLFLALDRVTGALLQFSFIVSHYGVWHGRGTRAERQALSARNFTPHPLTAWFWTGIENHAMHHLAPSVPAAGLDEFRAHLAPVFRRANAPLVAGKGWWRAFWDIVRAPRVYDETTGMFVDANDIDAPATLPSSPRLRARRRG